MVKDGLLEIKTKLVPAIGGSIFTNDEYHLTAAGQEFVGHLRGNEPLADIIAWAEETWPNGRHIYYEGGEPEVFAATIKDEFGLDVTSDPAWAEVIDDSEGGSFIDYGFDCPAALLGDIYYSDRWPRVVGSPGKHPAMPSCRLVSVDHLLANRGQCSYERRAASDLLQKVAGQLLADNCG